MTDPETEIIRAELNGVNTAVAAGISVSQRRAPICQLARKLLDAGHPSAAELHIYRDGTLCFQPMPLGRWAGLTVRENTDHPPRFTRFAEFPGADALSRYSG